MNKRLGLGLEFTALACLGAAVGGCGGWVDLDSPGGAAGSTSGSAAGSPKANNGGSAGKERGVVTGDAGTSTEPPVAARGGGGTSGRAGAGLTGQGGSAPGSARAALTLLEPPAPSIIPAGAKATDWTAASTLDAGRLEDGVIAGANLYCFKNGPSSQCAYQSREPFVWTEAGGMQVLDGRPIVGATNFYPNVVSSNGEVVVGAFSGANGIEGFFRWSKGQGFSQLGDPDSIASGQLFMSADGSVLVGMLKASKKGGGQQTIDHRQFRWTVADGYQLLADDASWPAHGEVVGLSADGGTLVGQISGATASVFRWTKSGGAQDLGGLPGLASCTVGRISKDAGVILGGCQDATQQVHTGFRYTVAGGIKALTQAGSSTPCAMGASAINADGSVAYGNFNCGGGYSPGRWSAATGVVLLPGVNGGQTEAVRSNADGNTAIGTFVSGGQSWDGGPGAQAVRLRIRGGVTPLGMMTGDNYSVASDLDGTGALIVGRSGVVNTSSRAVLWNATGLVELAPYLAAQGADLHGALLEGAEQVAVHGSDVLIAGFQNQRERIGLWIAKFPK